MHIQLHRESSFLPKVQLPPQCSTWQALPQGGWWCPFWRHSPPAVCLVSQTHMVFQVTLTRSFLYWKPPDKSERNQAAQEISLSWAQRQPIRQLQIHVDVWQKANQYCNAITNQLKISITVKKKKKRESCILCLVTHPWEDAASVRSQEDSRKDLKMDRK